MNKKGFTLVEILSVLVLIGLLLGLAIPGINKISSNMKKKSYNKKISLVENAAELWGQDNKTLLQSSSDCKISNGEKVSCYKIKIGDLISDNYLDSDNNSGNYINPIDNSDMKSGCVYVYKHNNRVYSYFVGDVNCSNQKNNTDSSNPQTPTDNITLVKEIIKDNTYDGKKAPAIKLTLKSEKSNLKNVNLTYKVENLELKEENTTDGTSFDITKNVLYFLNQCNNNSECKKTFINDNNIISNFKINITVVAENNNGKELKETFDLQFDTELIDLDFITSNTVLKGLNDNGDLVFTTHASHVDKNTTGSVSSSVDSCWVNYFYLKEKKVNALGVIQNATDLNVYDWNTINNTITYSNSSCSRVAGKTTCSIVGRTVDYKNGNETKSINNSVNGYIVIDNEVVVSPKFDTFSSSNYKTYWDNIFQNFSKIYSYNIATNTKLLNKLVSYKDEDGNNRFYCIIILNNKYKILTFCENLLKITNEA